MDHKVRSLRGLKTNRFEVIIIELFFKFVTQNNNIIIFLIPRALVAQKIVDEVVYRRFQGEGVEFF